MGRSSGKQNRPEEIRAPKIVGPLRRRGKVMEASTIVLGRKKGAARAKSLATMKNGSNQPGGFAVFVDDRRSTLGGSGSVHVKVD